MHSYKIVHKTKHSTHSKQTLALRASEKTVNTERLKYTTDMYTNTEK